MYSASPLPSPFPAHAAYRADTASPVSHASSHSSHSSHSSNSGGHEPVKQETGPAPHKRKSSHEGLLNGSDGAEQQMRDVGDDTEAAGNKRGRGKAGKKQKQQDGGEQPQRKNSLPSPVLSPTATTASRGRKRSVPAAPASIASTPSPSDGSSSSSGSTSSSSAPGTSPTASSLASTPVTPNFTGGGNDVSVCGLTLNPSGPMAADSWFVNQSTFQQVVQTFRTVILSASALTASNTTDIVCLMAHMMEVMPEQNLSMLLRILGYSPQPVTRQEEDPTWDGLEKKTQWRAPYAFLPYVTLPRRFRLNWSVSTEQAAPEDQTVINFPTLLWHRAREMSFVRRGDVIVGVELDREKEKEADKEAAPSPPSAAAASRPLLPSEIDMALLELPCRVEVNASFERMFGYSQSEVKTLFVRHGKQALSRLADPTQLRRIHTQDLKGMCDGQNEFTHVVDINTKYGSGMRTIMHHKLVIGESGMVCKKIYQWIPVPAALRKLEEQQAAKDREPAPAVAAGVGNKVL